MGGAFNWLFRLERQGVDVGARWVEIADKAEARIGDCLSAFTLPHWMMALVATKRWDAAERMIAAMQQDPASGAPLLHDAALPICRAILANAKGDPAPALAHMRPALPRMPGLGGSHAQQDVLVQVYLDCATAAKSTADIDRALAHVATTYQTKPETRVGYGHAAREV